MTESKIKFSVAKDCGKTSAAAAFDLVDMKADGSGETGVEVPAVTAPTISSEVQSDTLVTE